MEDYQKISNSIKSYSGILDQYKSDNFMIYFDYLAIKSNGKGGYWLTYNITELMNSPFKHANTGFSLFNLKESWNILEFNQDDEKPPTPFYYESENVIDED